MAEDPWLRYAGIHAKTFPSSVDIPWSAENTWRETVGLRKWGGKGGSLHECHVNEDHAFRSGDAPTSGSLDPVRAF